MKTEKHHFQIASATPPTVEIDTQAAAVYVRFRKGAVARTVPSACALMHIAIDLDAKSQVIGIEAVGVQEFNLKAILRNANVRAPRVDVGKVRYISAELARAGGVEELQLA